MPLNIKVEGDPGSIRTSSRWLHATSDAIHAVGTQINQARSQSESTWPSAAGASFRDAVSRVAPKIDAVSNDYAALCRELNKHADDLDTAKSRMRQARDVAAGAGLGINDDEIIEPGPEPPAPTPLSADKPATPEQQQEHAAATEAQAAFARKVQAYQECSKVVDDARRLENSSLAVLNRFVDGLIEKSPFNIADILTGLAGALAARTSAFRAAATQIASSGKLEWSARLMHSPHLSLQQQARAAAIHARNAVNMAEAERQAIATRTALFVDRLSPKTKDFLRTNLNFGVKPANVGNPVLRGSVKVLGKLPVVGLLVTAGGIGYDVGIAGKDPTTSFASGLGGYAAGAGTGALVLAAGGPVGWAVGLGAVASIGVGFAIEEWGDDAVDAVGDFVSDAFE